MARDDWRVFDLGELLRQRERRSSRYLEFLRVPALSCGVYQLPAGAKDLQGAHDEDEVYFVISGRGRLRVGEEERRVERGSILYVRATSEHHFFEIEEEMTLLVFFASGGPDETPPASARH
jgi:mannose-6-phosphate isomerase-like protein (cupin superfamily)